MSGQPSGLVKKRLTQIVRPSPGFPVMGPTTRKQITREAVVEAVSRHGAIVKEVNALLTSKGMGRLQREGLDRILEEPLVVAEIDKRQRDYVTLSQVTKERIQIEMAATAFVDPRKFFKDEEVELANGEVRKVQRLRNMSELDETTARAVHGFKITREGFVVPEIGDKHKALMGLATLAGAIPSGKVKHLHAHAHMAGSFGEIPRPVVETDDFDDDDLAELESEADDIVDNDYSDDDDDEDDGDEE